MATTVRIWTSAAHHAAFRCGGWAYVRSGGGQVTGLAGGERNTTAQRTALAGLVASLRDLPPKDDARVVVHTTSNELASFAHLFAGGASGGGMAPSEDLDLWAQILTSVAGKHVQLTRVAVQPQTPMGFVAAWAELARDKAKATGPFTASIPKPNLAKAPGLDAA